MWGWKKPFNVADMASARKVDQLKEDLAKSRKNSAQKTRSEKKAGMIDGAIELAAAGAGGGAAAALDHYQGEDGEPHKLGPVPTNALLGLGLGVAGILLPRKARMVGAALKGTGAGMIGYASGRFWEDKLADE